MPDAKITALTAISVIDPAVDPLPIVDVSDTAMAASGTTKKITINQILGASGTATLASATITGNLTVDTNTFFVDSSTNNVGLGTLAPSGASGRALEIYGGAGQSRLVLKNDTTGSASTDGSQIALVGSQLVIQNREASEITFETNNSERYRLASDGVATWSNVGGVAGTAMTLNSSGLGVGVSPGYKLDVAVTSADGIRVKNTLATSAYSNRFHISDNTGIALVGYCPSYVGGTNFGVGANGQSIVSDSAGPLAVGTNTAQSLFLGSNGVTRITLDSSGNVISNVPATAPTLGIDRQMVFNLTSNTNLRISVRGSDGVTRVANITLA